MKLVGQHLVFHKCCNRAVQLSSVIGFLPDDLLTVAHGEVLSSTPFPWLEWHLVDKDDKHSQG